MNKNNSHETKSNKHQTLYLRRHNLAENLPTAPHLKPPEKTPNTKTNQNPLKTPQTIKRSNTHDKATIKESKFGGNLQRRRRCRRSWFRCREQ
jgi:hypothetical protein